jgi:RIO kinase 2
MKALKENGFPVPEPVGQSRHTIVMEFIDAHPLRQIHDVPEPAKLYAELIEMILRLVQYGLIHGDFNEFNILIKETPSPSSSSDSPSRILTPILIDFPQMLSVSHPDAEFYFNRDVNCIKTFFQRRFHFTSSEPGPFFKNASKLTGRWIERRMRMRGVMGRKRKKRMRRSGREMMKRRCIGIKSYARIIVKILIQSLRTVEDL